MKKINLRELYPDAYTTDFFVNVTEDVLETIRASERAEAAYERKMYRYKAQYSLDCENGIENTVLTKPQTPEIVLEEKQLQKQVYQHSTELQAYRNAAAYLEKEGIDQSAEIDKVNVLAQEMGHRMDELVEQLRDVNLQEQKVRQEQQTLAEIQSDLVE